MNKDKNTSWRFFTPDLIMIEQLFRMIPDTWPDARGFFSAVDRPSSRIYPPIVNYQLTIDQGQATYKSLPDSKGSPEALLNLIHGLSDPVQVEFAEPTYLDQYGVSREVAKALALHCFARAYAGWVKFFSPKMGGEYFRPERMTITRLKEGFHIVIEYNPYWNGEEENVMVLVTAAKGLNLKSVENPLD